MPLVIMRRSPDLSNTKRSVPVPIGDPVAVSRPARERAPFTQRGGRVRAYHRRVSAPSAARPEAARALLRDALGLHAAERIEDALAAARAALELDPGLAGAHAYIGNTLVTRRRAYGEGIAALERAAQLAPRDAGIWFTLGWCQEFAANAIAHPRGRGREDPRGLVPAELYAAAKRSMLHAHALDPEEGLRGDIEDILDVIAKETGVPWDAEDGTDDAAPAAR